MMEISGESNTFHELLKGNILRIAECFLRPEREDLFWKAQYNVWNPIMFNQKGMLGGVVGRMFSQNSSHYVFSWWETKEFHDLYRENVWLLNKKAETDQYIESVKGYLIKSNENWLVLPNETVLYSK